MKRFLTTLALLLIPVSAQAGFSLKDITGKVTSDQPAISPSAPAPVSKAPRRVKPMIKPSLEIMNERYVPDDIKAKYKMGDDYFEMTEKKQPAPIVVTKKKALEIIDGPPPSSVAKKDIEVASLPEPVPLASKPALVVEGEPTLPPVPKIPVVAVPVERIDTWRARQGELLKDVLARWADREQTEFIWTAAESPKVSKEFSYIGKFDGAVAGLMAQDSGTLKSKFTDDVPDMNAPVSLADDMRLEAPRPEVQPDATKPWFGTSGASLQAVLHAWAESEGATLVWQSSDNFALPQTYSDKGSFEDAVGEILSQYESKNVRPVGQLYKNPISGEKVLVIRTDNAG